MCPYNIHVRTCINIIVILAQVVHTAAELRAAGRLGESQLPGAHLPRQHLGDESGPRVRRPRGPRRHAPRVHTQAAQQRR